MVMLSPGVRTRELDFSSYVGQVSTAIVGMVGAATKGPLDKPTFCSSPEDFVRKFGPPKADDYGPLSALMFLLEGNQLWYTRVAEDDVEKASYNYNSLLFIEAKSEGTDGENIETEILESEGFDFTIRVAYGSLEEKFEASLDEEDEDFIEDKDSELVDFRVENDESIPFAKLIDQGEVVFNVRNGIEDDSYPEATAEITDQGSETDVLRIYADDTPNYKTFAEDVTNLSLDITDPETLLPNITFDFFFSSENDANAPGHLWLVTDEGVYLGQANDTEALADEWTTGYSFDQADWYELVDPEDLDSLSSIEISEISGFLLEAGFGTGFIDQDYEGQTAEVYYNNFAIDGDSVPIEIRDSENGIYLEFNTEIYTIDEEGDLVILDGEISDLFEISEGAIEEARIDFIDTTSLTFGVTEGSLVDETTLSLVDGETVVNYDEQEWLPQGLSYSESDGEWDLEAPKLLGEDFSVRSLEDGNNGTPLDVTTVVNGLVPFKNTDEYDINILVAPGWYEIEAVNMLQEVAKERGDAMFIADTPQGLNPQEARDFHNGNLDEGEHYPTAPINTNLGAMYYPWLKVHNRFTGENEWLPPSGLVAGVYAHNDREGQPWYAPAGLNRGMVYPAIELEYELDQGERDLLYGDGDVINPITNYKDQGIVIWGQRTLQRKNSALDRVNVRRLLLLIRKSIAISTAYLVFEQNDSLTWRRWVGLVEPFLESIQANRGLYAFRVQMDEEIVTDSHIDRNQMPGRVFLQPTKTAEFIPIDFILTPTGAEFG